MTTFLALLALAASACKALTAEGKATVRDEDGVEVVTVDVQTEPKAWVFVLEGMPDGPPADKITYAGATSGDDVYADEAGKATLRLPIWKDDAPEKVLTIGVWRRAGDFALRKTPRFDFTVKVSRAASLRVEENRLTCVTKKCRGLLDPGLTVKFWDVDDGSKLTVGDAPVAIAAHGKVEAAPDVQKILAAEDLENVLGPAVGHLVLPVSLELADGTQLTRDLEVPKTQLRDVLHSMMARPDQGPISLPGDVKGIKGTGALMLAGWKRVFGEAKKPSDIDFVAMQEEEAWTKDCGLYRGDDGATSSLVLNVTDALITIYDRRTGKLRARQKIPSDAACPQTIASFGLGVDSSARRFAQADVDTFLTKFVVRSSAR